MPGFCPQGHLIKAQGGGWELQVYLNREEEERESSIKGPLWLIQFPLKRLLGIGHKSLLIVSLELGHITYLR